MKRMKKAMSFLIAAGCLILLATPICAESQAGSDQWQVAFDGQEMKRTIPLRISPILQ